MQARMRLSGAVAILAIVSAAGAVTYRRPPARPDSGPQTIVASIRAEPRSFNRYVSRDLTTAVVTYLLHAGLVRINRVSDRLEPELAESWDLLPDGRTYRLHLRRGTSFSDGVPFTAADVLFSFRAIYDRQTESIVADSLLVDGRPLEVSAEDDETVVIRFPSPFGPGLRLLDGIPILPRHRLERALADGSFRSAWGVSTPPADVVGLGPFVLREYRPGQRLILERNPYYWRREGGEQLPHIDRLVLEIFRDQDAESLALQTGSIDFTQSELRPMDVAALKSAAAGRRIAMTDLGVGIDGDLFWINLSAEKSKDRRSRWLQHPGFRRAISQAVDRGQFVDTVFLGAAVPGYGAVSPGNREWYVDTPAPQFDIESARRLLDAVGLQSHDGFLEDSDGAPVRFTLLTQQGNTSLERGASVIRGSLSRLGIQVDVAGLEAGALIQRLMSGDYDAAYFRLLTTDTDPALNIDFWRTSGSAHVWNPAQRTPATPWESEIDRLMDQVATRLDPAARKRAFGEVQRIMAREMPAFCFAFPRLTYAMSTRLSGTTPAAFRPPVLWNPAVISVSRQAH